MLGALATGVLLGVCQIDLSPLAWVALAPLAVAAHGRRPLSGAGLGMVAGLVAGAALYGLFPYGWLLYGVLVVYCGVHMAGFGLGVAWLSGRVPAWARVCLPALLWTGFEYLRRFGVVSFPISLAGSQSSLLPLTQLARWTGAHGVSFLVALPAGLALSAFAGRRFPIRAAVAQAAVLGLVAGVGAWWLGRPLPAGRSVAVAGVQTGLPGWVYRISPASAEHRALMLDSLTSLTERGMAAGAELVVWPETAFYDPVLRNKALRRQIEELARRGPATILVGTPREDPSGDRFNSVLAFLPGGGEPAVQDKLRPAGYAEWHITPGRVRRPLDTPSGQLGVLICLESVYAQDVAELVDLGAELIVVTTDDSGFRRSPIAEFHARRSSLRAIETGRTVVHLSQAGPSYVFDARGRALARLGLFERGLLQAPGALSSERTAYQRLGDAFCWGVWVLLAGLASASSGWARRFARPKSST